MPKRPKKDFYGILQARDKMAYYAHLHHKPPTPPGLARPEAPEEEDMAEKLFVIMEVIESPEPVLSEMLRNYDGTRLYIPTDEQKPRPEYMWLKPERVIPASRLRYGKPQKGQTYFDSTQGLLAAAFDWNWDGPGNVLILSPPAPADESYSSHKEWIGNFPRSAEARFITGGKFNHDNYDRAVIAWLRRMPRGK